MNVYDFDGTIYGGDSTVDFFLYALKRKPALLRYLPRQVWGFLLYAAKRIDKTELKEYFFCFLPGTNTAQLVDAFWDCHQDRIYGWFLRRQQPDDIIISASPAFLLQPICNRLGIQRLIASQVDPHTGKFTGANCRGAEKVRRLQEEYGITQIDEFFSDSQSDLPLALLAQTAFLVVKGEPTLWPIAKQNGC